MLGVIKLMQLMGKLLVGVIHNYILFANIGFSTSIPSYA
jgi:hypothetical protein